MNSFERFIIAHLIADYLFQNNWMALNKGKKFLPLACHMIIYMFCMAVAFPGIGYWLIPIVLLHGLIDRLSIADKYLKLIKGRNFDSIRNIKTIKICDDANAKNVYIGFTCIVYAVSDFLIHFLTTYPLLKYGGQL